MTTAMLPRRGTCLVCRTNGHGVGNPYSAPSNLPRQFSSVANSKLPRSLSLRVARLSRSCRPQSPAAPAVAASYLLSLGTFSQRRLQSTVHNASNVSPVAVDTIVPPSESLDPLTRAAAAVADGRWELGFLRDAGNDFGWGTSTMVQWIFEHIHVWGGYEVGVSILIIAVVQRVATFPLLVQASDHSARFRAIGPKMTVLQAEMRVASQERNQVRMMQASRAMADLRRQHGIQFWKMFLPMIQMPLGFGLWRALRNAAVIPAPGMTTGGFLWFQNLTISDPYFILPAVTGIFQHLVIRFGGETGNLSQEGSGFRNFMLWGLPTVSVVVTAFAPAAVQIVFASAAGLSFLSNLLLRNPNFRSMCGISPRVASIPTAAEIKRAANEPKSVYKGTINVTKNVKREFHQAHDSGHADAAPSKISGIASKLNPRNWFKAIDSLQDEASKITGGSIKSVSEQKKANQVRIAKEKVEDFESKRSAERQNRKIEWHGKDNSRQRRR